MKGQISLEYLIMAAMLLGLAAFIAMFLVGSYGTSDGISQLNHDYAATVVSMLK